MLVDAMQQNLPLGDQYACFKAMKSIAENLFEDDVKYRTLYADNKKVQKRILKPIGGYEFFVVLVFVNYKNVN